MDSFLAAAYPGCKVARSPFLFSLMRVRFAYMPRRGVGAGGCGDKRSPTHTTKLTASNMEKAYYQEKEGPRWFVRCALFPVVQPRIFLTHFDLGAGAH